MTENTIKNARTFLMRIELKATEIDAFVEVLTALSKAKLAPVPSLEPEKPSKKNK